MSRGVQKSVSGTLPSLNKITLRKLAVQKVRKEGPINGPTGGYPCNTDATCTGTWCCYSYGITQ